MLTSTSPRLLQKYLFKELITIFGLSLLALTVLFMVVLGIKAVQGGYSLRIILPWIFESITYSFYFTAPLSLLIASTLGYGRFVVDREYTAAAASGIRPFQLAQPMLLISGVLGIIAFATQGTVLPHAHYKQRNITRYLVKQLEHLGDSKKGKLQIDKEDGMVYWDQIRDGRQLEGVHIEKRLPLRAITFGEATPGDTLESEEDQVDEDAIVPATYINARSAVLELDPKGEQVNLALYGVDVKAPRMEGGYLFDEAGMVKFYDSVRLSEITVQFPINEKNKREGDWTNAELREKKQEHRQEIVRLTEVLARPLDDDERARTEHHLQWVERRIRKSDGEIWFRRSLALSVLTFGLIGFPVSITFRHKHRMVPFFIGVMLVVGVFYPLLLLGKALVKNQGVPAPFAMLAGNVVLLAVAGFLSMKLSSR